ncbi:MAG: hypothetical protein AAFS07_19265, partial [Pseudomonadota bacterium]
MRNFINENRERLAAMTWMPMEVLDRVTVNARRVDNTVPSPFGPHTEYARNVVWLGWLLHRFVYDAVKELVAPEGGAAYPNLVPPANEVISQTDLQALAGPTGPTDVDEDERRAEDPDGPDAGIPEVGAIDPEDVVMYVHLPMYECVRSDMLQYLLSEVTYNVSLQNPQAENLRAVLDTIDVMYLGSLPVLLALAEIVPDAL